MPSGFPWIDRKTGVVLVVVVAMATLVVAWDWNWFRGPVANYFSERSQRQVRIGDLDISFNRSLEPTVRLQGLYVQNAPWADDRPFVTAQEVSFTFALRSIPERRPIISRLVLIDADVNLERQADGHRNWRLRNPENLGPGRVRVMRLDAQNSRIRFIRRDTDFEVVASSEPLAVPSRNVAGPLTKRVLFEGRFRGSRYAGNADTGDELSLLDSGELFPIRGQMRAGKARLDFDGSLADLFDVSKAVGSVHVEAASLAALHPFTRQRLADSKPFEIRGQLRHEGGAFSIRDLRATIGRTVLTGVLSLDPAREPPLLKAALHSDAARLDDLESLVERKPGRIAGADRPQAKVAHRLYKPMFSDRDLPFGRMRELDAEISLRLKKLQAKSYPGLESFAVEAELKDGVMHLAPEIGLAEGDLRGTGRVDAREEPATVEFKLAGRDVRIEKLLLGNRFAGTTAGPVAVRIAVKSQGGSMAALAANLDGSMALGMSNGVISNLADAVLELNPARAVRAVITGNRAIGINRIDVEFDFRRGQGSARNIFIDTEQTRVVGTGSVDLRTQTLDILLTAGPSKRGILALDAGIRLSGPIRKPRLALVQKQPDVQSDRKGMAQAPGTP
jgi:uncharacterized protein involved in outer membrane biogenesis